MPVRVKQRTLTCDEREQKKQWEKLVQKLVAVLLAWGLPVTLVLKNREGAKKLIIRGKGSSQRTNSSASSGPNSFDVSLIRSVLSQAAYIEPLDWNRWIETSAVTASVSIRGAISLQPAPSKRVQFMSLGIHHVDPGLNKILYDEVNQIFASSDFGKEMDGSEPENELKRKKARRLNQSEITARQLKGGGKGADRWPMFFIRIDLSIGSQMRLKGELDNMREDALLRISSTLKIMITSFLKDHHFRPHTKRRRLHDNVPSQEDRPVEESQDVRSGLLTLASAGFDSSVKNHAIHVVSPGIEHLIDSRENEQNCVSSAREDSVLRPTQSQNPSYRSLYSEHGFSTWSRIKSGIREDLDALLSQRAVSCRKPTSVRKTNSETDLRFPVSPPLLAKGLNAEAGKKSGKQNDANENENVGSSEAMDIPVDAAFLQENPVGRHSSEHDDPPEKVIRWTNPVTGATVYLSTRTGLEVRRLLMQPASSNSKTEMSRVRKSKMGVSKLTQSSSDPFSNLKEGSWVSELLKSWDNPVFKSCEESIPVLSFGSLDEGPSGQHQGKAHPCSDFSLQKAFTESSSRFAVKLSKDALSRSRLIAQVDQKFLLVCMDINPGKGVLEEGGLNSQRGLVLIDQHAADERIRLEEILADLCRGPSPEAGTVPTAVHPHSAIATIILPRPITFTIHQREGSLFTADASHFAQWGILYSLEPRTEKEKEKDQSKTSQTTGFQLIVRTLPEAIAERCRVEPKMLIDLLRAEVWKRKDAGLGSKTSVDQSSCSPSSSIKTASVEVDGGQDQPRPDWLRRVGNCPQGILDMLYSRACRSAIMFNDTLTGEECELLLRKLSKCAFPFQCAHGRPSMVPLVRVGGGEGEGDGFGVAKGLFRGGDKEERRGIERVSGASWKGWIRERKRKRQEEEEATES